MLSISTCAATPWNYNFPRNVPGEVNGCTDLMGGTARKVEYLEVWALKSTAKVTKGGEDSKIVSEDDFVRMTNSIKRYRPDIRTSARDSVTPVPGMWQKCWESEAAGSPPPPAPSGPQSKTQGRLLRYRNGVKPSNIMSVDDLDWIVGEISGEASNDRFGKLTALVHKCYDLDEHPRKGSEWHSRCNGFGPTLTVIELTNGQKIAGFMPESWNGYSGWRTNIKTMMFTVNDKVATGAERYKKFKPTRKSPPYSVYDHSSYGPTFGGAHCAHDLHVAGNNMINVAASAACTYNIVPNESPQPLLKGTKDATYVKKLETWVMRSAYQSDCANKGPSMVMVKTTRGNTFGMYAPHSLTNFNFDRVGTLHRTGQSYFYSTDAMVYDVLTHQSAYSYVGAGEYFNLDPTNFFPTVPTHAKTPNSARNSAQPPQNPRNIVEHE
jgi:hypothetical protein